MRVSIAIATFNGADYLEEQLDSFTKQIRLPDEVIVSDDCSTDKTIEIIKTFAKKAPFEVKLYQNSKNIGFAKNFEKCIKNTTGDIVFLSDQDDFWHEDKISRVLEVASQCPTTWLFMNDTEICHSDMRSTRLTKLGQILSLGLSEKEFNTGCCMAIRRELIDIALPIPEYESHDNWIGYLAEVFATKKVIPIVLQKYRRHSKNTSSWIASSTKKVSYFTYSINVFFERLRNFNKPNISAISSDLKRICSYQKRLLEILRSKSLDAYMRQRVIEQLDIISAKISSSHQRLKLLKMPRMKRFYSALQLYKNGGYKHFYGLASLVKDLLTYSSDDTV